jgi:hypothetical protein
LVDVGFDKHLRVNHGNNEFARGSVHVNGIESFWSYAKRRLMQFNGVLRHTFLPAPEGDGISLQSSPWQSLSGTAILAQKHSALIASAS